MALINVDYLIDQVRVETGDLNPSSYRYLDEWISISLMAAVRSLSRRWSSKYLVTDDGEVSRNTNFPNFEFTEPPVIQEKDERPIVIAACIILLEGSLENSAYDISSWRDSELSYSNLEQGRIRTDHLTSLRNELDSILLPPSKRLIGTRRNSSFVTRIHRIREDLRGFGGFNFPF